MAGDPVSSVRGIIEIAERLFGRLGPAVLIATLIFFLVPHPLLLSIGINTNDPGQKFVAGVLLLLSLAITGVNLAIFSRGTVNRVAEKVRERHAYRSLSLESRVLLGVHARFREDNMIVPPDCEAAQALLDRQYMSGVLQAGQLSIGTHDEWCTICCQKPRSAS